MSVLEVVMSSTGLELEVLRQKVTEIALSTEVAITGALKAVLDRDSELAKEIIRKDDNVDQLENEIDQLATEILTFTKPGVDDLRFTVTVMHTVPMIERIADHAVNIAKHSLILNSQTELFQHRDLLTLGTVSKMMFRDSVDSLLMADAEKAHKTIERDDEVDHFYHSIYNDIVSVMERDTSTIKRGAEMLFIIKHFERIADYSTNICEMAIYMVENRVIKHTHHS